MEDFKAYVLIFAIKNDFQETVARLWPGISFRKDYLGNGYRGSLSTVALSLASQPNNNDPREGFDKKSYVSTSISSLFEWAVESGHAALVASLLHEQVFPGSNNTTKYFIHDENKETSKQGSINNNINGTSISLDTIMAAINFCGSEEVAQLFLASKTELSTIALHAAVGRGQENLVRNLLAEGFDKNSQNGDGETLIMTAVAHRPEALIAYVLEEGASTQCKFSDGRSLVQGALTSRLSEPLVTSILARCLEHRCVPKYQKI